MTGTEILLLIGVLGVCGSFLQACLAAIHYATWPFAWAFRQRTQRYLVVRRDGTVVGTRPPGLDHVNTLADVAEPPPVPNGGVAAADARLKSLQPQAVAWVHTAPPLDPAVPEVIGPDLTIRYQAVQGPGQSGGMAGHRDDFDATPVLSTCQCRHCIEKREGWFALAQRFVVCPDCGNKRCPKSDLHTFDCTGSNEPNQKPTIKGEGAAV
jgi:hypothetical protein